MNDRPTIVLPQRYYLDHFNEMVGFVREHYDHAIDATHRSFLDDFDALSLDARCLYVRIANRKGLVFPRAGLRYEEIDDLERTLSDLAAAGFIRSPTESDYRALLALQTKPTLLKWIVERSPEPPPRSSAKKRDVVNHALHHVPFGDCFPENVRRHFLVQDRVDEVDYLFYLYFGKLRDGLVPFALRDLGLMRTAPFQAEFEARFESRESALSSYHYERMLVRLRDPEAEEISTLSRSAEQWPIPVDPLSSALHARAVERLGRLLERDATPEEALAIYSRSDRFPATERTVRLLVRLGREDEAKARLESMIEDPSCDEELVFAEDFHARRFGSRKVGRLTDLLRQAEVLPLDETGRGHPEQAAVAWFARRGIEAWHVENAVWQQLFGLLFWDLLHGASRGGFHNGFEWRLAGLDTGEFASKNAGAIDARLGLLEDPTGAIDALEKAWKKNEGAPNAYFGWYPELFEIVKILVTGSPPGAIRSILAEMVRDHKRNRSGFPDLLLRDDEGLRFLEIKTEGDRLQRHQLAQLDHLWCAGFRVGVARIDWTIDPEQEYVVVDVETTGGNPSWNRVTEIGAVRVRGGKILEEWSTLLNPDRRIPTKIVELTGITDEMVADAPRFPEIAEEFRTFVGDAVFAAHRAKFDHGFLKAEYERIGEDFRPPLLCTVVAMRRHFPRLASYGLANLCREFAVPLENHHRALDDARATARLLIRINEERSKLRIPVKTSHRSDP